MSQSRIALFVCVVCLAGLALVSPAHAATLRVCASGCAFTNLQAAIDAAAAGDTILLRAGETFVGPFILRKKPASTSWITIRSDASDSLLPAAGVRLVPIGKPGGNTARALLPRLLGQGGALKTTPVVRTEPGAHHYILRFLEIDGSANLGFETLIALGADTTVAPATDIVIDRVYAHGHPYKGIKRGISLNSARTDILNSYVCDIKAVNADSQALAGYNGAGPFRIINNYLEGAGENIIFGGSDPAVTNLVPTGIEVKRNHLYKPLAWQNAILSPPGTPRASASSTAGRLTAGTHYFRIVAVMDTDTRTAVSLPSTAVAVSVAAGQSVAVSWSAVAGADRYRIYRGASAASQSLYLETTGASTSFTYTGTSEKTGAPATSATKWVVKNLFELKNAQNVLVEGNIIENVWQSGQYGYALVLTPRNQNGTAPWVRVRDVTVVNNIVRHASGVLQLSGYDSLNTSQQTQRITLRNNLFYDIDPAKWGGGAKAYLIGEGAAGVVLDHNTLVHTNSSVVYAYGTMDLTGFVYTNNISLHHSYGIMGEGGRPGQYTIDKYFPGSRITNNVLAGGPPSSYPAPNAFPTVTEWNSSFANAAGGDYRLLSSSVFYRAGEGGSIPGANLGAIDVAIAGGVTTDPAPEPPPPSTNTPPIARPGGPYTAAPGVSLTVDGGASTDAEGAIASYTWRWGDEIVARAADVAASDIVGTRWARVSASGAAGGVAIHNPNRGEAKRSSAALAPASYVDVRFNAAAGVAYRLWFRMRAEGDQYANDSMFVQFDGAVDSAGQAAHRIGTSSALDVILEEGTAAGVSGWGWNDGGWGTLGAPVYFGTTGVQTMRIQQREDGVMWDQVVLSAVTYFTRRPGATRADATVLPASFGAAAGVSAAHVYASPGVYPLVLTVVDGGGAVSSAATRVTVASTTSSATLDARAGGPYSGAVGQAIALDGSTSTVPSGATAAYRWTFGDDIVLHAGAFSVSPGRWALVADTTAAGGSALENVDLAEAKKSVATANPASHVEATFAAAAGVPYRVWVRMRAARDAHTNDSVFVQFSGSVTTGGAATTRIGTSDALPVILEEGSGAGVQAWGWADASYGGLAAPVYFNADGVQRIRIQQREDGIRIDQVVISASDHFARAPGASTADATIVPVFGTDSVGPVVNHAFRVTGAFPVTLVLDAGTSGRVEDRTVVNVR